MIHFKHVPFLSIFLGVVVPTVSADDVQRSDYAVCMEVEHARYDRNHISCESLNDSSVEEECSANNEKHHIRACERCERVSEREMQAQENKDAAPDA